MIDRVERPAVLLGLAAIVAAAMAMAVFMNVSSYNDAVGAVVALGIVVVSVPAFRRLAVVDDQPQLVAILIAALVAKLLFSLARYWMVNKLYGGGGDSNRYAQDGWLFAQQVRSGSWIPAIDSIDVAEDGTRRIVKLTGYIYAVTGRSVFAGFFIYAWLAFWGCVLFWRGARHAFPEMDHRRYMYLVLFWPSLLFWPSSIGKDAVMVFLLGVASYGACRLLAPKPWAWGLAPFVLGVGGMLLIRSHVALMAVLAVAVATAFALIGGTRAEGSSSRGRAVRIAGLVVIVGMAVVAATQTTRFFTEQAGEATSQTDALQLTVERTQKGGSQFDPIVVTSPVQVPAAAVSVLFRPFVWEVNGVGMLISSIEGAAIGVLALLSWRRLRRWPGSAWRRPILLYGAVYCLMFVVAFSSIGNAGILARQRSQMLPLLFLAFAVPATKWWAKPPTDEGGSADIGSLGAVTSRGRR